jgi:hypothetical protein
MFEGTAKLTLFHVAPSLRVMSTMAEPPLTAPEANFCGTATEPVAMQFSLLAHTMSERDGCGADDGRASGTHERPPSLVSAMSLTIAVLLGPHSPIPSFASAALASAQSNDSSWAIA